MKGAVISADGRYRYTLTRRALNGAQGKAIFIMLNPSTADASIDDPTIRRCVDFTRRWQRKTLLVLNLFAMRATNPRDLAGDIEGPDNWKHFDQALNCHPKPDLVVCAWGTHGSFNDQDKTVMGWLDSWCIEPLCLGLTKDGHPRHPLYVKGDTILRDYRGRR